MAIIARVTWSARRFETTPQSLLWEGSLRFEDPARETEDNPRAGFLLGGKFQVWKGSNGPFLVSAREVEGVIGNNGKAYTRARKDQNGKYQSVFTINNALSELGLQAVLAHLEEDAGRGGDGGYMEEGETDFSNLAF